MAYNQSGYGGGGGGYGGGGYGQGSSYGQGGNQYNNYSQPPYGQPSRYEPNRNQGAASPYAADYNQRSNNAYAAPAAPAANPYEGNGYSNGGFAGQNENSVEMTETTRKSPIYQRAREIIKKCETAKVQEFGQLEDLQNRSLASSDPKQFTNAISQKQADIDLLLFNFKVDLEKMKDEPTRTEIDIADMKRAATSLLSLNQKNQEADKIWRDKKNATIARQYKITNPNASPDDVKDFVNKAEHQDGQIYSSALLSKDRTVHAQTARRNVEDRSQSIQKLSQDLAVLLTLFENLNVLVVQQAPQVEAIEQSAQQTETDLVRATEQLHEAGVTARATRRKKWICLGIVVAIILIIVIIIVIVVEVKKAENTPSKTSSS